MCGIAGFLSFDPAAQAPAGVVRRMTDLIAHRGPDDEGQYAAGNVALGHRRLSILDLSAAGHQPMANDDASVWIIYNGECYNFRELARFLEGRGRRLRSRSDTEVILRLYEELGPDFVSRLEGMFAFAIWDGPRQRLLLARDRLGIKPLYYFADRQHLSFASELKALIADPAVPSTIDPVALSGFLHLMSVPDPTAIFAGVQKLLPGHVLLAERGQVTLREYWDVQVGNARGELAEEEAVQEFSRLFGDVVHAHMIADVPVGAFLSGGVDSSAVVALAGPATAHQMETFSITFKGHSEFDESPFARAVAGRLNTRHHEFDLSPNLIEALPNVIWHADEPFAITSSFALYFLAREARSRVKVVLTGDGGDEVFAGYPWRHRDLPPAGLPLPAMLRRPAHRLAAYAHDRAGSVLQARNVLYRGLGRLRRELQLDDRYVRTFCCYQDEDLARLLTPEWSRAVRAGWANNVAQRYFDRHRTADQLSRKLYTDIRTTLVSEMLTKVDRMTMAHGLEARVPFLDHRVVEWAFRLPAELKLRGGEGKVVVKRALEPYLPRETLYRPKQGFNVPMRLWMRGQLREFVRDALTEQRIRDRGLFRYDEVRRILADHEGGTVDASNKIFVLLATELWFQRFVDGRRDIVGARAA
jgi:asparagine synthase (glutamine-hydrolysing)